MTYLEHNRISLVLTHYNRFDYLLECVAQVLSDPRIGEIVISDDCSTDGSYERIREHFKDVEKVKIFRNEENQDCYRNKATAMSKATLDWAILFDSDNILTPAFLDVLYLIPVWDSDIVYCPEWAEPHFDYRAFVGVVVSKTNVAHMMAHKHFGTVLNTCNYFVHRQSYLSVWDASVNPHTSDSIYQMYNWFRSGKKLVVQGRLRYFHRVHEHSHFKKNNHKTGDFHLKVENKLKSLS